jgi:hypothetical protein
MAYNLIQNKQKNENNMLMLRIFYILNIYFESIKKIPFRKTTANIEK